MRCGDFGVAGRKESAIDGTPLAQPNAAPEEVAIMFESAFNRPRRQFEPRMYDERGRELGGEQSRAPDQSAAEQRDPGADALAELARLISQPDPFSPVPGSASEVRKPDGRVADVSSLNSSDRWGAPTQYTAQSRDRTYDVRLNDRHDDHGDRHDETLTAGRHPVYGQEDEYLEDESGEDDYEYEDHEHSDEGESSFKRRNSTKVVIAVLGLAVFGSAAAFGYRTVFKADLSGPTPVIRADNSPTKVMPAATDANPMPVNQKLGDNSGERLVRRDEDPVDIGASLRSGTPGDVGASAAVPDTAGVPPPAAAPASSGPGSSSDARRVRTVTIRADQGAAASSDRTASSRSAAPPPPPAPPPPRQTAALSAPAASVTPTAVAPEAAASQPGGFVVQLSAQRSETDAQTAFRTMQAKYSVLNGHQLLIRRKDQGERGIFYAAQVGPFGAKSDADQLCETLKSAGGACFVQKN